MGTDLGELFARAIAAKDARALLEVLHPEVDFRGMTPGRVWEANLAPTLVDDIILGKWFSPSDVIESIDGLETATVGDRPRVGYRFRVTNADGAFAVEQQAYFDVEDDRITWLRVLCSGYRAIP
ncbi:MAG: hypothetical protein ACRDZU_16925 [Acidimicrobiales bacterium]